MSYHYFVAATLILGVITPSNAYECKIELIESSPKSDIGEGPHWDEKTQSLYYVDIFGTEYSVLRYCASEDRTYGATIDDEPVVSFIIPVHGTKDEFAVGLRHRVGIIRWNGKSRKAKLIRIAKDIENCKPYWKNRFNDAKADPRHRLWAGTMRFEECDKPEVPTYGNLFRFSADEPAYTVSEPKTIQISNGLAWDEKRGKFYYIDSCDYNVVVYDYDSRTGNIWNQRVLTNFTTDRGLPDGMTIDTDGNIWVAKFGGGEFVKINSRTGKEEFRVEMPAGQVTSLAFGGKKLDELYVTTAGQPKTGPQTKVAGHLFRVKRCGARGLPAMDANI